MALTKLVIPPDQSGYSVTDGNEVLAVSLDGGASRFRRDVLGATSLVNVQWSIGPNEYKYIRSFYRALTGKGAKPFLIDLYLDEADLTEHKSYFVPGTMKLLSQKGLQFVVSVQLEVYPAEIDEDAEAYFVVLFSELGENWETEFPILENEINNIINFEFPRYLE
ncbi:MAG: hypothetical protein CMH23_07035 [Methylophaga sp.]|uniref:hypothetical protein n=1 Tax=Methylophaga sp. TaxID=2024840 RepID=UPI000C92278E|nr:hypothetical protein [Methylophaga sp.]MBN46213.1 hypothetical protein [Methylophaga sp.]QDP56590.1 MAG: hypothetical protein GOVbin2380_25 [Prokaryotic dsDNA virus sp.]|tara:strand:- start:13544 stop:14038 length:495 start_codon:yes stop_codon:yes gene_type:complete